MSGYRKGDDPILDEMAAEFHLTPGELAQQADAFRGTFDYNRRKLAAEAGAPSSASIREIQRRIHRDEN